MAEDRHKDDETLDALDLLSDSSGRPLPRRAPDKAPPKAKSAAKSRAPATKPAESAPRAATRPAPAPRPTPAAHPAPPPPVPGEEGPVYRCLNCGYPLGGSNRLQCTECGRTFQEGTLDAWYDGVEEQRFEHVLWFVAAALFLKLFIAPPQLLWITRMGAAVVVGWGCYLAGRGKTDSVGGYFGMAGTVAAVLMFFSLWNDNALPYYTLDMIGGSLLLLAMLHGPGDEKLGSLSTGRPLGLVFLFVAPAMAVGCYIAERATAQAAAGAIVGFGASTGPRLFGEYSLFMFLLPFLASTAVWITTLILLRSVRKRLFAPIEW